MTTDTRAILLINGAHGIYIPQIFGQMLYQKGNPFQGIDPQDLQDISDPDNEFYWEAWDNIMRDAYLYINDIKYVLYQYDGDVWIVPEDFEYPQF